MNKILIKRSLKITLLFLLLLQKINGFSQDSNNFEVTLFKGSVSDSLTKLPVEAKLELYNAQTKELIGEYNSNSETGKFLISLHPGKKYRLLIIAKKYQIREEFFEIVAKKFKQLSRDYALMPIEPNQRFALGNIVFEAASDSFKITDNGNLDIIEKFLLLNNKTTIEISAFNLKKDTTSFTRKDAETKLNCVYNYILSKGVPSKRMLKKYYPLDTPLVGYKCDAAVLNNGLRFEFKVVKK